MRLCKIYFVSLYIVRRKSPQTCDGVAVELILKLIKMKTKHLLCYLIICILSLFIGCEKENDYPELTPDDIGSANINSNDYGDYFLYGSNMGWLNNNWRDEDIADMLVGKPSRGQTWEGVGVNSLRLRLHEGFVEAWGFDNKVNTFKYYCTDLNTKHNVIFIGEEPCDRHRDGNSGTFKNLYEPVWVENENGITVNERNYYAWYVYNLVIRYKDYVTFWEIFSEPDLDNSDCGWRPPGDDCNWWDRDPPPSALKNLKAPIQSYIRMLRISYEVIKSVDPDAFVCVGGLGYPSFLDAILRNTDNPDGGKVTERYPQKGGAWFDCLSFHCYPIYYLRTWGNGGWNHFRHSDAAAEALINLQSEFEEVLRKYGYGGEYPAKEVIVTETNIPRVQEGDNIGSPEAQRNYLIKAAVVGQKNRIRGIYPFSAWDTGREFDYMGFYQMLPDTPTSGNLRVNESGIGWRTVSAMLRERKYDPAETAKLALPSTIEGGAFHSTRTNDYVYALWAKTSRDLNETVSATYSFPTSISANRLNVTSWNGTTSVTNGRAITLSGNPVFIQCN